MRLGVLLMVLVLTGLCSLLVGDWPLAPAEIWQGLMTGHPQISEVILQIRLPRMVLALLMGMALGGAGAALQALFQNPLADPGVLGVSGVAAFAAALGISAGAAGLWAIGGYAVLGAAIGGLVLVLAASVARQTVTLVLFGAGLASLAGSGTALVFNLSPTPVTTAEMMNWLMGSVAHRDWRHVGVMAVGASVGLGILMALRRPLDMLRLGEETATSLGVQVRLVRLWVIAGVSILSGLAVAVAGVVGFVGLAAPHVVRGLVRPPERQIMPMAALMGGGLTVMADLGVRLIPTDAELKLGVITALLGAPILMVIALRYREVRP